MYTDKQPNRFIRELRMPIMGSFFLCGLNDDGDFTSLPEELAVKFRAMFWQPEVIVFDSEREMKIVRLNDGTKPD